MRETLEEKNKRHLKTRRRPTKKAAVRNVLVLCLSVVLLVAGIGCVYADSMLGRINVVVDEQGRGTTPSSAPWPTTPAARRKEPSLPLCRASPSLTTRA